MAIASQLPPAADFDPRRTGSPTVCADTVDRRVLAAGGHVAPAPTDGSDRRVSTTRRPTRVPRVRRGPVGRGPHPLGHLHTSRQPDVVPANETPMALTTRGRVLATLASVAVVVVSVLLVGHAALNPVSGHTTGATTTLRVPAGDSARDLAARVQPGVDPDITVARILTLNGLPSAAHLEPGMAVTVPVDTPVS